MHASHLQEVALSAATDLGATIDSGFIAGHLDFPVNPAERPVRLVGLSHGLCD